MSITTGVLVHRYDSPLLNVSAVDAWLAEFYVRVERGDDIVAFLADESLQPMFNKAFATSGTLYESSEKITATPRLFDPYGAHPQWKPLLFAQGVPKNHIMGMAWSQDSACVAITALRITP